MNITKNSKSQSNFSKREINSNYNSFKINNFLAESSENISIKKNENIDNLNNYIDSSGNFYTPNEFKELWETIINTELIDLFDFCIKDYVLIANLCQDILLLVYEESKIIIERKFSEILKCLNLEKKSTDKKNRIYSKFLPFFQENFNDIFLNVDSSLNTLHNKLINTLNEYPNNNFKNILQKNIKEKYFDNLIKSFFKICIYMLLHDPILTFDLVKLSKRKLIYCFYNKNNFINVEGFGNDKSPCIIILPPPLIKNKFPFNGLKPAVYIISESNENIIKECEFNKNNNIYCNQKNDIIKVVKTLTKSNNNSKSENNIYISKTFLANNNKILPGNMKNNNGFYKRSNNNIKNNEKINNQYNKLSIKDNQKINNNSVEFKGVQSIKMSKINNSKKELISRSITNLNKNQIHQKKILNSNRESNNVVLINDSNQNKLIEEKEIRQIKNKRQENYRQIKYNRKNNKFYGNNNNKLFVNNTSINNLNDVNNILNNISSSFNNNNSTNSFPIQEINKDVVEKKIKNSNSHNNIRKLQKTKYNTNNYLNNMSYKSIPYLNYLKQKNKREMKSYIENEDINNHFNPYMCNSENENIHNYIYTNFSNNNTNINSFNVNIINNCLFKSEIRDNLNNNKENLIANNYRSSSNINNKNYYMNTKKDNIQLNYRSEKNNFYNNAVVSKNSLIDSEDINDINQGYSCINTPINNLNDFRKYYNTNKSSNNFNINFMLNDNNRYGHDKKYDINKKLKVIEKQRNSENNYKTKKNIEKSSSINNLLSDNNYNIDENINLISNYNYYFNINDNSNEIIQKSLDNESSLNNYNLICYENKNKKNFIENLYNYNNY